MATNRPNQEATVSQGPTTVGSIVGKLKLDASEWDAELTKAGVKADELGRKNPNIKVDADVAAALAKLEQVKTAAEGAGVNSTSTITTTTTSNGSSVTAGAAAKVDALAAAERRLALAESASESATARALVAEMKFEESRKKRGRTAAQVAAAELALSEAIKRSENAAARANVAEEALAAAQRKTAEMALLEAAAQDTNTASKIKANEANSTTITRTGLIAAAVAALVPMMVPLAAFTIGAAGALTVMGISGLVAVKGIKDEMAMGTAVGQQYTAGLGAMKSDLDSLAQTAAVGMLTSFKGVTAELSTSMPMLNVLVSEFTGFLGRTGSNLFSGAITGVRILEPLMVSISGWVEKLSLGFKSWTQNGGLQSFANYAMASLPQVEATLSAVATAVMHILTALAPLGSVGLTILTAVSQAISGLPVETLSNLIGGITAAFFAFKTWGLIGPILATVAEGVGAVGLATTLALGPIGWVVAGVGALVAIFAISAASTQQATVATDMYTDALRQSKGAIDENVRSTAIKSLTDAGAMDAADRLGISLKTVTDAALGNVPAQKAVAAQLAIVADKQAILANKSKDYGSAASAAGDEARKLKTDHDTLAGAVDTSTVSLAASVNQLDQTKRANETVTASTDAQTLAVEALAKKYGMTTGEYLAATTTQQTTAAQLSITTQAMFIQGDAAGLLRQSLDLLNGKTLSAAGAQNQFDSQLANMSTHMDAAGKTVNRADTELEGMTASAVKNRGELIALTTAAQANAEAFRNNGGKAEETKQKLIDMKQSILDNAAAHGEDTAQVQTFIDTIFKIPDSVPPVQIEADTAAAEAKLHSISAYFTNNPVVMRVADGTGSLLAANGVNAAPGRPSSDGSTVGGSGSSSIDSVHMMLAPGEEVISNKQGQASRYRPLLKQINAGMVPSMPSSSGSSPASSSGSSGGGVAVTIINKAGAALADLIDVRIQTAAGLRKIDLSTGLQKAAY